MKRLKFPDKTIILYENGPFHDTKYGFSDFTKEPYDRPINAFWADGSGRVWRTRKWPNANPKPDPQYRYYDMNKRDYTHEP